VNGRPWDSIPRCRDRPACRQRFNVNAEAQARETEDGKVEPWPLHDSDWAERLPLPEPADVVEAGPVEVSAGPPQPEPEPPPAWAMSSTFVDEPDEDMPWV
jgi:hypothetical protein